MHTAIILQGLLLYPIIFETLLHKLTGRMGCNGGNALKLLWSKKKYVFIRKKFNTVGQEELILILPVNR
jgi:hypothetical protein